MDAVEQLLGWPVQSRRDLGNQEGIEGIGRVDEHDMLTRGQQRGDRPKGIGEDSLAAAEQDETTLRPPAVEGKGELGKDEPGRRNPFQDYTFRKTLMTFPKILKRLLFSILMGV